MSNDKIENWTFKGNTARFFKTYPHVSESVCQKVNHELGQPHLVDQVR